MPGGLHAHAFADLRYEHKIEEAVPNDVAFCAICVGTTAFPTVRWRGGNPESNAESILKLIRVLSRRAEAQNTKIDVSMLSSAGVDDPSGPIALLNAFGAISWLKKAEQFVQEHESYLQWSIMRPGRLIGGPLTSYDLNTATGATDDGLERLCLLPGNAGPPQQTSRAHVARCMAGSLFSSHAKSHKFVLASEKESSGNGKERQSECAQSGTNDTCESMDALFKRATAKKSRA